MVIYRTFKRKLKFQSVLQHQVYLLDLPLQYNQLIITGHELDLRILQLEQDLQVLLELKEILVLLELKEMLVLMVLLDLKVLMVLRENLVLILRLLDLKEFKDLKVL